MKILHCFVSEASRINGRVRCSHGWLSPNRSHWFWYHRTWWHEARPNSWWLHLPCSFWKMRNPNTDSGLDE